jgi:hypothetical protein
MSDPYPHQPPEAATEPSPVAEENAQQPRPARLAVTLGSALAMEDTYSGMLEVACLLAEKAAAAGASGYSITSATNNNKLSGTAVIYK